MKKFISLTFILGLFAIGSVMAQTARTEAAEKITKQYTETINLTEDQSVQAKTIFADHLKSSKANWDNADGDKETFQASQKETFKATDAKIKALLNDEQLAVYESKKQDLKKRALDHYVQSVIE